ncbi:MAG TPA: hypothetical protein DCG06_04070, partial [Deltaproteobacteria bacterium]|nr:hypothetical protein [Deltaproteobacteria bacterium]
MRVARYIAWDGRQELRLDPDEIFQAFADALSRTDDATAALEMLLRDGFDGAEARLIGLDELREELAEERRRLEESVNLDRALDELRERFDEAVRSERQAR